MILRGLARLGRGRCRPARFKALSALQKSRARPCSRVTLRPADGGDFDQSRSHQPAADTALDGGHLSFFLYEALFRRPIPLMVQGFLLRGGISILLALTVVLVVFDVARLFGTDRPFSPKP